MLSTDQISPSNIVLSLLIVVVGLSRLHDIAWVMLFVSIGALVLISELLTVHEWLIAGFGSSSIVIVGTYWILTGNVLLGLALIGGTILILAKQYIGRPVTSIVSE